MAKLFEQVINPNVHPSSADLLIHFASFDVGINPPQSPRHSAAPVRNSNSPSRTLSAGGTSDVHVPTSIRCHSLVLRTQKSLLETLIPNFGKCDDGRLCSPDMVDIEVPDQFGSPSDVSVCPDSQFDYEKDRGDSLYYDTEKMVEATVNDEPEVFLEMIKFIYLSTCHVDHSNVKALMQVADKYGVEDIAVHCLQWMHDHFSAHLFYHFLSFKFSHSRFSLLLRQSLLSMLRSRRNYTLITDVEYGQWEQLDTSFMEQLLSCDDLPVVSEAEVLQLVTRWAKGVLAPLCAGDASQIDEGSAVSDMDCCGSGEGGGEGIADIHRDGRGGACDDGADRSGSGSAKGGGDRSSAPSVAAVDEKAQDDMLRLLQTLRKTNMLVKISDIEPILQIMNVNHFFSTKQPRENVALNPGFMIYRGVAPVNVPATFGDLNQPNVVSHAWRGGSVSLGGHDFLQQQDGFRPASVPDGGTIVFPRLWVRITCSSWAHREKRGSLGDRQPGNPRRHGSLGSLGAIGSDVPPSAWESVSQTLMSMPPVNETGPAPTLKLIQSQDDAEVGRKHSARVGSSVHFSENEKVYHKVVCTIVSGHMRHGIRIGQHDRSSIYEIEELYGQREEVCLGGTHTDVEFELQLTVQAPNQCGICRCALAILPHGAQEQLPNPLLEVGFDASSQEQLHFHISSCHFDSNSSYTVALNWVLRPGMGMGRSTLGSCSGV